MGSALRIGIDIRLSHAPSGQQRYLWRLGEWLGARGHESHLLCTVNPLQQGPDPVRCQVHELAGLESGQLVREVRALELDALLLNPERSPHYAGIRANVLRPGYGTDQFLQKLRSIRNPMEQRIRRILRTLPPKRGKRRRERDFYRAGRDEPEVLAISDYIRDEVLDSYSIHPDRVHVVPNGVDTRVFSPAKRAELRDEVRSEFGVPADAVCLLTVAHNFRLKGVQQTIQHLARLRSEGVDAHYVVAGRGTGKAQQVQAQRWADKTGVSDFVHLVGGVSPAMRAFAAADVFIHLSWHDAFGFVVLEAMAAGLPPLTTPYAGASMLVKDGANGFVARPEDSEAVYRAIRSLMDLDARVRMGAAARATAERYTEEVNFEAVEEVIRTAAARTGRPVA